jgi:predicted permease
VNLVLTVLQITAPVFLLGTVGLAWVRGAGWDYPLTFVTRLTMTVAMPCLIFTALMQAEMTPDTLAAVSLATLLAYGAVIAATWPLVALARLDRRTFLAPLVFGNTGNIGLPLALFAFGDAGLGYAVVIFAVMAVLTFTIGIWMVAGAARPGVVARDPMVVATALGALFLWQGWETPGWLTDTLALAGQMAIPLMLVTLGVAVARLRVARLGRPAVLSLLKAAVSAGAGVIAGRLTGLDPVAFAVLVVQMVTPVAVTSYLLAEKYEADAQQVAGLVVVSTALSVGLLPLTLGLLLPTVP